MNGIQSAAEAQAPVVLGRTDERAKARDALAPTPAPAPLPEHPPLDVLAALDTAADVIQRLEAQNVHLHFDIGDDEKVHIQIVDQQGNVLREIPPQKALELLSGGRGSLAVDALG